MGFGEQLWDASVACGAPVCVGLDPHLHRLPAALQSRFAGLEGAAYREAAAEAVEQFCLEALEGMAGVVPAVKPQAAFFEALGAPGVAVLERVVHRAQDAGLLVVFDAKRGDIGSTAEAYAHGILDDTGPVGADSVTLSPYLGAESLAPFTARLTDNKGLFVLVRTSNPGSDAWQLSPGGGVAHEVAAWIRAQNADASGLGDVGAVIGATISDADWRALLPKAWFLMPGIGAQGASPADVARHFRPDGSGVLITSSRAVLFGDGTVVDGVRTRAQALRDTVAQVIKGR